MNGGEELWKKNIYALLNEIETNMDHYKREDCQSLRRKAEGIYR